MNKKILHLNFSDDGGAAIAVMRIHAVLKKINCESLVLVAEKFNNQNDVFCNQKFVGFVVWHVLINARKWPSGNSFRCQGFYRRNVSTNNVLGYDWLFCWVFIWIAADAKHD